MVTYAQTNGTTISATNLNNAFREEVSQAESAWKDKYKHLWRFSMHLYLYNSTTPTIQLRRYFYAPDDMFLVGMWGAFYDNSAQVHTVRLAGDTENVEAEDSFVSMAESISTAGGVLTDITRKSFDAATDEKMFLRKGALYYIEVTPVSGKTSIVCDVGCVFALAKRPT